MSRKNLFYTACVFVFILCASAETMAKQPNGNHYGNDKNGINTNNGNHYGNDKNGINTNNGNHYGNDKNGINANSDKGKKVVSVPEPSTLAVNIPRQSRGLQFCEPLEAALTEPAAP